MRRAIRRSAAGALVWLACAAFAAGQAETAKIKVVSDAAVVFAKPDIQSQVLDRPPAGTLLDLVKRTGEWYEVRIRSRLGMLLPGYIHRDAVETPAGETVEPAKAAAPPPVETKPGKPALKTRTGKAPGRKILQIGLGGFMSKTKVGGSRSSAWAYRNEELTVEDNLSDAPLAGLDIRIGIMPLSLVEVEATFHSSSPSLTGSYRLGVPNAYRYNDMAYDETEETIPLKSSLFTLGVVFHPLARGIVRPYLGLGVAFGSASLKVLEDITYTETTYVPSNDHEIDIKTLKFENVETQKTGWAARLGLDVAIIPALFLFAEGIYASAGEEVRIPLASKMTGRDITRKVEMGGARGAFGLKIRI